MSNIRVSGRVNKIEYAIRDVVVYARKLENEGHEILKLNIGDPIEYDFETPDFVKKAAIDAILNNKNQYSPSEGIKELREEIARKEKSCGVNVSAEDVVVTTGVTEAIMLIFGALLDPGDEILVPGPTYPPYITYANFYDAVPISYRTVEEDNWQPDIEDIRRKITSRTKAIVIINPNNPTGALYERKILEEIMNIAAEHNLLVISDEIYDKIVYEGEFISPPSLAKDVPSVVLNGISKVYLAPGWRIGYIAFRDSDGKLKELKEAVLRQARARLCPNTPFQYGYLAALRSGDPHLSQLLSKLRERRDFTVKFINEEIEGMSVVSPRGAFYLFPKIENCHDDKKFVLDLLFSKKVLLVHGSGFCPVYGKGHIRIVNLPPIEYLQRALERIKEFMKEWKA